MSRDARARPQGQAFGARAPARPPARAGASASRSRVARGAGRREAHPSREPRPRSAPLPSAPRSALSTFAPARSEFRGAVRRPFRAARPLFFQQRDHVESKLYRRHRHRRWGLRDEVERQSVWQPRVAHVLVSLRGHERAGSVASRQLGASRRWSALRGAAKNGRPRRALGRGGGGRGGEGGGTGGTGRRGAGRGTGCVEARGSRSACDVPRAETASHVLARPSPPLWRRRPSVGRSRSCFSSRASAT